jgi:hypothetical protein
LSDPDLQYGTNNRVVGAVPCPFVLVQKYKQPRSGERFVENISFNKTELRSCGMKIVAENPIGDYQECRKQ